MPTDAFGLNTTSSTTPTTPSNLPISGLSDLTGLANRGIGETAPETSALATIRQLGLNILGPSGTGARTPGVTLPTMPIPQGADMSDPTYAMWPYRSPEETAIMGFQSLPRYIGEPQGIDPYETAGVDTLRTGAGLVMGGPGQMNSPEEYAMQNIRSMVGSNYDIGTSPYAQQAIAALQRQFQETALPQLQNQAALAGLGNSGALLESIRRGQSDVAANTVPILQSEMQMRQAANAPLLQLGQTVANRPITQAQTLIQGAQPLFNLGQTLAQRPLNQAQTAMQGLSGLAGVGQGLAGRELQNTQMQGQLGLQAAGQMAGLGQQLAAREQIPYNRFMETSLATMPINLQMAQMQQQRQDQLLQQMSASGGLERQIAQAMSDAQQNEYLRQQGLAETSVYGPFGQIAPSTTGFTQRTSGGGFGLGK